MASGTTEIYTILVQTSGSTAAVKQLVNQLDQSNRAVRQTQTAMGGLSQATGAVSKSSKVAALQLQNVGYQVQDFFVQINSGTSASRALGQQLPQLTSGFGAWGIAIGTAVAALGPFIPMLLESSDAMETSQEALDKYIESVDDLSTSVDTAARPINDLRSEFGSFAVFADQLSDLQVEIDTQQAQSSLEALKTQMREIELDNARSLRTYDRVTQRIADAQAAIAAGDMTQDWNNQLLNSQESLELWADSIKKETGLAVDQFRELGEQLRIMQEAPAGSDSYIAAQTRALELLDGATSAFATNTLSQLERINQAQLAYIQGLQAAAGPIRQLAAQAFSDTATEVEKLTRQVEIYEEAIRRASSEEMAGLFSPEQIADLNKGLEYQKQLLQEARDEAAGLKDEVQPLPEFWEDVDAAIANSLSSQEKAAEEANRLRQMLERARKEADGVNSGKIAALEAALRAAERAANGTAGAIAAIQSQINSLNLSRLRSATELAALQAGYGEDVAKAAGDASGYIADIAGQVLSGNKTWAERAELIKKGGEYLTAQGAAVIANTELEKEYARIAEAAKASEGGGGAAGGGGTSTAEKAATEQQKALEDFKNSVLEFGTEGQKLQRELDELRANTAQFWSSLNTEERELAMQGIADLEKQISELGTELSQVGEIMQSGFQTFFDDLVEGSKTASEAFEDMLISMLNNITSFLFSQQLNALMSSLAQLPGFGFMSAGGTTPALMAAPVSPTTFAAPMGPTAPTAMASSIGYGSNLGWVQPPRAIPSATAGSGLGSTSVVVNNYSRSEVETREGRDEHGDKVVEVLIRDKVRELVSTGALDSAMRTSYGLRRQPG